MKKLISACLCSCCLLPVFAQQTDTLKARAGGFSTELNVNLFESELNFNNVLKQIKGRYFISDQWAMRVAFSIDRKKENHDENQAYGTNAYFIKDTRKTFSYSLGAGFEYHFKGTRRLSPYLGAEAWFGKKKSSETIETKDQTTEIEGAWMQQSTIYVGSQYVYPITVTDYIEKGFVSGGFNLLAGFDFYVAKNFYLGYEFIVLGISIIKYDTIDITYTNPSSSSSAPVINGKDFEFGPSLINGIRVGYFF